MDHFCTDAREIRRLFKMLWRNKIRLLARTTEGTDILALCTAGTDIRLLAFCPEGTD